MRSSQGDCGQGYEIRGAPGQGLSIFQAKGGECWLGNWYLRGNFGGGWNSGLGIGLGREFRPLATLGVTERGSGWQRGSFDGAQDEGEGRPFDGLRATLRRTEGDPSTRSGRPFDGLRATLRHAQGGPSTGSGGTERGRGTIHGPWQPGQGKLTGAGGVLRISAGPTDGPQKR